MSQVMDTEFVDETGQQIPVEFQESSVIGKLLSPLKALREAVRS